MQRWPVRLVAGVGSVAALIAFSACQPRHDAQPAPQRTAIDTALQAWLYPRPPAAVPGAPAPAPLDSVTPVRVPRGRRTFVASRLHDLFFAPDWDSTSHAPMPAVVAFGRRPAVYACAYCHMPDGAGRPENAAIAGLPAEYITRQVHDIRSHARRSAVECTYVPVDYRVTVAGAVNDQELAVASR